MDGVKLTSIVLLLVGSLLLAIGLAIYWLTDPVSPWASVLIMFGILILIGAIIILCIAIHNELEATLR